MFYLLGISTISVALGINENIGIATFGTQTKVVIHMTNEYDKVLEALGKKCILSATKLWPKFTLR